MRISAALFFSSLVWFPRDALACATCYGDPDAVQTHSMNMAIFTLLGVIGTVLFLLTAFFVFLMIRTKRVATKNSETQESNPMDVGQLVEANAHE